MKKIFALALVLVMAMACGASAQTFVSLATGGTGGTYYPVGGGVADIVSRNLPDVQMTAETGNASVANCNLIGTHQIEMAFVQNDVACFAHNAKFMFNDAYKNINTVACLYPETIQVIAMESAGVNTMEDLKAKAGDLRISVGAPGSGVQADVSLIMRSLGLKYSDFKSADFLDFNNTSQRMKDGQVDVGFIVAGFPTAAIMDLATMHDITLLQFSQGTIDALHADYPFFVKNVVPAGTYKGVDGDTVTVAVQAMWICDGDMDDALVYDITKAFWTNVEDLYKIHSKAKMITLDTALEGASVPVHPGAVKYYEEMGLTVPVIE